MSPRTRTPGRAATGPGAAARDRHLHRCLDQRAVRRVHAFGGQDPEGVGDGDTWGADQLAQVRDRALRRSLVETGPQRGRRQVRRMEGGQRGPLRRRAEPPLGAYGKADHDDDHDHDAHEGDPQRLFHRPPYPRDGGTHRRYVSLHPVEVCHIASERTGGATSPPYLPFVVRRRPFVAGMWHFSRRPIAPARTASSHNDSSRLLGGPEVGGNTAGGSSAGGCSLLCGRSSHH